MSLLGRMFGGHPTEPDPAEGAYEEWRAEAVTPEQIEAEELRQLAATYLSDARFYDAEAARYEAQGEPVKAAVARKHGAEERAGYERCQARLAALEEVA